ncbi:hypothetical protein UFOVP276_4 [uncultured Caudovirales phage]|uniref:Uncharacterized protein n=1 Tax=uncultured Caudovirales phage TaxID=2100421 RepID=A0A6J5LBU8_9CAUD|nr:hypothetical protein UFOVP127_141 [uncultured Caudovirales phage]CAB4134737.1 hypothetical protein UFOVP276_4 [uncultured Caudovirales phage]
MKIELEPGDHIETPSGREGNPAIVLSAKGDNVTVAMLRMASDHVLRSTINTIGKIWRVPPEHRASRMSVEIDMTPAHKTNGD